MSPFRNCAPHFLGHLERPPRFVACGTGRLGQSRFWSPQPHFPELLNGTNHYKTHAAQRKLRKRQASRVEKVLHGGPICHYQGKDNLKDNASIEVVI